MSSSDDQASGHSTGVRPTNPTPGTAIPQPEMRTADPSPANPPSNNNNNSSSSSSSTTSLTSTRPRGSSGNTTNARNNANKNASPTSPVAAASSTPTRPIQRRSRHTRGNKGWKASALNFVTSTITLLAFFAAVAFGIGAWLGMDYANKYANMSRQLSLWGTYHDHDVSALFLVMILSSR
jgi:hypothetical protein